MLGTAASSRSQMLRAAWTETCWPTIERIRPLKPVGTSRSSGWPTSFSDAREIRIDLRQMPHRLLEIGGIENHLSHARHSMLGGGTVSFRVWRPT